MKRRCFAAAMALCLCLSLLPPAAFAAQETDTVEASGQMGQTEAQPEQTILPQSNAEAETEAQPDTAPESQPEAEPQPELLEAQGQKVEVPNADSFTTNEAFIPYDKHYPQNDRLGQYSLQVPELKGRLTFREERGQRIGTLYAPGVSSKGGWKDAAKRFDSTDSNLCFAAASSNLISWYVEQYKKIDPERGKDLLSEPEQIFDRFRQGWYNQGGDPNLTLSWYFTGGLIYGNDADQYLNGKVQGGFLKDKIPHNSSDYWSNISTLLHVRKEATVYGADQRDDAFPYIEEVSGMSGNGALATIEKFSSEILRQLHYGPSVISILKGTEQSGHAVTLWGADYDVDTGLVTAIHVTDSDDREHRLIHVQIQKSPGDNNGVRMVKYPMHPGTDGGRFEKIRDAGLLYAPGVVVKNRPYDGPSAEILRLVSQGDGLEVTVEAAQMDSLLEYGYAYENDVAQVKHWQSSRRFVLPGPDQYYFFVRVAAQGDHYAGGQSAGFPHRAKTSSPAPNGAVPALSLGVSALEAGRYVWYGTDQSGQPEPILWKVVSDGADSQSAGRLLLSEQLFGKGANGGIYFAERDPYVNRYQGSGVQRWCQSFIYQYFSATEQSGILSTTRTDSEWSGDGVRFGAVNDILWSDQVFLPSAQELDTANKTAAERQRKYRGENHSYWLRSPSTEGDGYGGYVTSKGKFARDSVSNAHAVRPAFRLDNSKVLYTAAVGQNIGQTGLAKLDHVQSSDFRVVLADSARHFQITEPKVTGQSGGVVTLSYQGAYTGEGEYLSVILVDSQNQPLYYGRVAPAETWAGNVSVTLPDQLADGVYTLKVFNEQYRGDRESGQASQFCNVELIISGQAEVVPVEQVHITVDVPVKGGTPEQAAVAQEGCTVGETVWSPNHSVFAPSTQYTVSVVVKPVGNYRLTQNTTFYVNNAPAHAEARWDGYMVTYDGFSKTEAEDNGGSTPDHGGNKPDNGGSTPDHGGNKPDNGGSSGGGGSASGGGGGSASTSARPEITQNPDGSRTETATKADGTKVETTTWPSGDRTVVETGKDGAVTTSTTTAAGTTAKTATDARGNSRTEVVISQKEQEESQKADRPVELPIPAQKPGHSIGDGPVIQVNTQSRQDVVVTIPVSSMTPGTTVVLVGPDGREALVRKCANGEDGVTLPVEDGVVLKLVHNHREFADTVGHWAQNSIDFVTSHQLYAGTSDSIFSPDAPMTRGMLAVVLHNLEYNPASGADTAFQDVEDDLWYAEAIQWAAEQGIVSGYGNGQFGPNDQISREQLVVMLYHYAHSPAHSGGKLSFQDADQISPYAREAMEWAVERGILSGTGNNMLAPQGTATRAQVAVMLVHLLEQMW